MEKRGKRGTWHKGYFQPVQSTEPTLFMNRKSGTGDLYDQGGSKHEQRTFRVFSEDCYARDIRVFCAKSVCRMYESLPHLKL